MRPPMDAQRSSRRRLGFARDPGPDQPLEWRLLLACLQSGSDSGHLVALSKAGPDWRVVLHKAALHRVRPLLHQRLRSLGADCFPRHVMAALWAESERIRRRNSFLGAELLKLLSLLQTAGVEAAPFKGPVLASSAYGDIGL